MFKPGQSGNPGGRSKAYAALSRYIRAHTKDGEELADHLLLIARDASAEPGVRLRALTELLDRGIGKAPQTIDLKDTEEQRGDVDWAKVPLDQRREVLAALTLIGAVDAGNTEH
jgi:hypothetical protein